MLHASDLARVRLPSAEPGAFEIFSVPYNRNSWFYQLYMGAVLCMP